MTKQILIFAATFLVGAIIALAARTALHEPHRDAPALHAQGAATEPAAAAAHPAAHSAAAAKQPAAKAEATANKPVNTVCAICGMDVDPKLPTLEYQGKQIGFGCRMCPPKFKAEPDKYGPYYLRNEVIKR